MSEKVYDEYIAPKLMEIGTLCKQLGLPLVAQVEYAAGDFGLTRYVPEGAALPMKLMDMAAVGGGNVDSLFIAIERHARKHGHSSIYLHRLGIPTTPEKGEKE